MRNALRLRRKLHVIPVSIPEYPVVIFRNEKTVLLERSRYRSLKILFRNRHQTCKAPQSSVLIVIVRILLFKRRDPSVELVVLVRKELQTSKLYDLSELVFVVQSTVDMSSKGIVQSPDADSVCLYKE